MTMSRAELTAAAEKAFEAGALAPDEHASWEVIARMGWFMLGVPEDLGGLGQGGEARAVIHHVLGRALIPGPVIAQMMVIDALAGGERSDGADALIAAAMTGTRIAASLALTSTSGMLHAVSDADRVEHVLDLGAERVALYAVRECEIKRRETWDTTRRLFDVKLPENPALVLAEGETARALSDAVRVAMLLALSADSLGGAESALAMTVEYLGTRRQFGRPLAMFQALKHRVADLRMRLSVADALLWQEAAAGAGVLQAGALKAHACRVYQDTAEEMIQLHGGVGLTLEHDCHLFLKRASLNAALGGDADHWEEQAGRALLDHYSRA